MKIKAIFAKYILYLLSLTSLKHTVLALLHRVSWLETLALKIYCDKNTKASPDNFSEENLSPEAKKIFCKLESGIINHVGKNC